MDAGQRLAMQIGDDVLRADIGRGEDDAVTVTMDQSEAAFGEIVPDRTELTAGPGLTSDGLIPDEPAQVVSTGAGRLLVPSATGPPHQVLPSGRGHRRGGPRRLR